MLRRKVFASVDTIYRDCFKNERVYSDSWSRFAEKPREVENLLTLCRDKQRNEQACAKLGYFGLSKLKGGSSTALGWISEKEFRQGIVHPTLPTSDFAINANTPYNSNHLHHPFKSTLEYLQIPVNYVSPITIPPRDTESENNSPHRMGEPLRSQSRSIVYLTILTDREYI